jgi:hypothetical protein
MASWAEHSLSLPLWSDPASRPLEDAAASPAPCDAADSAFQGLAMLVADGALALAPHAPQSPARSGAAGAGGCDHAAVGKEGLEPPCAAAEAPAGAPGFRCLTCVGPCYRRCVTLRLPAPARASFDARSFILRSTDCAATPQVHASASDERSGAVPAGAPRGPRGVRRAPYRQRLTVRGATRS